MDNFVSKSSLVYEILEIDDQLNYLVKDIWIQLAYSLTSSLITVTVFVKDKVVYSCHEEEEQEVEIFNFLIPLENLC